MSQKNPFVLSVIPLLNASFTEEHSLSYTHTTPLSPGSLVRIPLGKNRFTKGIVQTSKKLSEKEDTFSLKPITSILFHDLLDDHQLLLAQYIARRYFSPLGKAFLLFVPSEKKPRNIEKYSEKIQKTESIILTQDQKNAILRIKTEHSPLLLFGPPSSGKTEVIIEMIRQTLKKGKQSLLLLPEISLTAHSIDRISKRLEDRFIFIFHSKKTQKERFLARQSVASGCSSVIVGSRSALFLPFKNLGLVVVDEEHDDSYKQTLKSPRYDAREIAEELARLHNAKILLVSSTPRPKTFFRTQTGNLKILTLPPYQKNIKKETKIRIVDMRLTHWKHKQRNLSPPLLSKELLESIHQTLREKKQIILLVSHQGMYSVSLCVKCKNIFRCPKCDRSLIAQYSGHYLCLGGHFRTTAFPKCPACGGLHFLGISAGTQKIEEDILRAFPSVRLERMDSQSFQKKSARERVFSSMVKERIDILIGTQMAAKGWNIPRLSLVGIIDSDAFFSSPDYSADMRTAQLFFQARGRLGRTESISSGTLLIQTYHPERPLFSFLEKNDFFAFLKEEMQTREILQYPPYKDIVHLVGKHKNDTLLKKQSLKLFQSLATISPEGILVSRPVKSFKRQKAELSCRHIVIKIPTDFFSDNFQRALENIPRNWYIDRDPISLEAS